MKKIAILLVVASIACGATVCQYDQESMITRIDSEGLESDSRDLNQRLAAYHCFREVLECTMQSLDRGEIALADAARRVHDAAQTWPVYLNDLETTEIGKTPMERIARNLIGHFENRALLNPSLSRRLRTLEAELRVLVRENGNLP